MKKILLICFFVVNAHLAFSQSDSLLTKMSRQIDAINKQVNCIKCAPIVKKKKLVNNPPLTTNDVILKYLIDEFNIIYKKMDSVSVRQVSSGSNNNDCKEIDLINARLNEINKLLEKIKGENSISISRFFSKLFLEDIPSELLKETFKALLRKAANKIPQLNNVMDKLDDFFESSGKHIIDSVKTQIAEKHLGYGSKDSLPGSMSRNMEECCKRTLEEVKLMNETNKKAMDEIKSNDKRKLDLILVLLSSLLLLSLSEKFVNFLKNKKNEHSNSRNI